jgi:hypothetical protein
MDSKDSCLDSVKKVYPNGKIKNLTKEIYMKRFSIISLSFIIAVSAFFSACRKDDSTFATDKLPNISFGHTLGEALTVYQFNTLQVDPEINYGGADKSKYTYTWMINPEPRDTSFIRISEEEKLNYEVSLTPNTGTYFHILKLYVTDIDTKLQAIHYWRLTVLNNIGEGLVIATTKDNSTTDFSHIMSPEVTTNYTDVSVKRNILSGVNGSGINGLVKDLYFANVRGGNRVYALTANNMYAYNTLNYSYVGDKNDLFITPLANLNPSAFYYCYQNDVYLGNDMIYYGWLATAAKIGVQSLYAQPMPKIIALNANSTNTDTYDPALRIHYYDEKNGKFGYIQGVSAIADKAQYFSPNVEYNGVNSGNYPGKTNVAAGISVDRGFLHVLKDKTSGAYELLVFDGGVYVYGDPYIAPRAIKKISLATAPEIANATQFVMLDDQNVMFYATANKIYAVIFAGTTVTIEERYTAPAGETITTLDIYRQYGYPNQASYISTNNKQLILSTYNGTEGKVRLLPLVNLGAGNINTSGIKTFNGFDKVLSIVPQK